MAECGIESVFPTWSEADRLAELRRFEILDTDPEAAFDDLVQVAAQVCQAPVAAVTFVDEHRQWFKSEIGLGIRETSLDASVCAHAILQPGLCVVPDTTEDPRFASNPLVVGEPALRFYAGAPLQTDEGLPLGTLCVLDYVPRPGGLSQEQAKALLALARAVMSQLTLRGVSRALESRRKDLAALADGLPQVVWSTRADGSDDYTNKRWYEFTGAAPGSAQGNGWRQFLHPDDQEQAWADWRRSVETGTPYEVECRLRHRSGEYRWVLARALPTYNECGKIDRWFGTYTDIDAWKRVDQALVQSQERLQALIETSAVAVWGAGPDGLISYARGTTDISGFTEGIYEGAGWIDAIHPEDRPRVRALWQEALSSGASYQNEFRIKVENGEYRWIRVNGVPLKGPGGDVREWVGSASNIHDRRQAEERLRTSEERLRLALETTSLGIWDIDLITGISQWTPETRQILGISADAPITRGTFLNCVHPDDRPQVESIFYEEGLREHATATSLSYSCVFRIIRADTGEERWVTASGRTMTDDKGLPVRKLGTIHDITERKRAEDALRASEERLRLALHAGRMIAWEQDLATDFVTRSQNCLDLLGIGSSPLPAFLERVHPEDRAVRKRFLQGIDAKGSDTVEFRYVLPNGRTLWLGSRAEKADPNRVLGVTFDITDRKTAEEEVWRAANHDALTGLPNRALFQRRLEQALATAKQNGTRVSLLLIDLDDFKDVNDSLGHDAGDALLRETGSRLSEMICDCDTVARYGGDEFALLVVEPRDLEHTTRFAELILEKLRQPFTYQQWTIASRASIGVTAFPDHNAEPAELMKDADIALYRAKAQGRNQVVTYSWTMRREIEERFALVRDVREAISRDQFVPFYQPKVCLSTGRITGFEALARWQHPGIGILTPAVFGPVFQDHELATAIGKQMIAKVASDMRSWFDDGFEIGRMALNLSSAEFSQQGVVDEILGALAAANISPEHIEIEVTETVLLGGNSEAVSTILKQFRAHGIRIALDDFGTGYASLTHLKQFPVDHIKIDRSFVRDIEQDPDDEAIVAAIVGLGRSMDLEVTAEGVETIGQARRLKEMGCCTAQGHLYAKPVAGSEVPRFLSTWNSRLRIAASSGDRRPGDAAVTRRSR